MLKIICHCFVSISSSRSVTSSLFSLKTKQTQWLMTSPTYLPLKAGVSVTTLISRWSQTILLVKKREEKRGHIVFNVSKFVTLNDVWCVCLYVSVCLVKVDTRSVALATSWSHRVHSPGLTLCCDDTQNSNSFKFRMIIYSFAQDWVTTSGPYTVFPTISYLCSFYFQSSLLCS